MVLLIIKSRFIRGTVHRPYRLGSHYKTSAISNPSSHCKKERCNSRIVFPGVCLTDGINVPLDGPVSLQLSLELSKEAVSESRMLSRQSAMRDHHGGDKPLCPTIQGKLIIKLWTERKHFSPILCHGRGGQLRKSILSCKKIQYMMRSHSHISLPRPRQQLQGKRTVLTLTALMCQFLVCAVFIMLNSWASILFTIPCRSHQQSIPLFDGLALQNQCQPWRILACLRDVTL